MKKIYAMLLITFLMVSCCDINPLFVADKFDLKEEFKYDGLYTGIDTLIRTDGYYYNLRSGRTIMFFKNGEIAGGVVYYYGISDNIWGCGKYNIVEDTIKTQLITDFGIKCSGVSWSSEYYYKIIDRQKLLKVYFRDFNSNYIGLENDTLVFVESDFLMLPENQEKILKQNWLRKYKRNWKEGYYPEKKQ